MLYCHRPARDLMLKKRKKDALLPDIHMKFPDSAFDSLPCFRDKVKVSVWKTMKTFGPNSEVATNLVEIVDDKKWRSALVVISPGKRS